MQNEKYMPPSPISSEFWEDEDWAYDNYIELVKMYPDQWVAVVDKKVIASGNNIAKIVEITEQETGRKEFPVIFLEKTVRVYKNRVAISESC